MSPMLLRWDFHQSGPLNHLVLVEINLDGLSRKLVGGLVQIASNLHLGSNPNLAGVERRLLLRVLGLFKLKHKT